MNRSSQSAFVLGLALALTGCPKRESEVDEYGPGAKGLPTASGLPAPVATGLPGDPAQVSKVVNPKGLKAFDGSTGDRARRCARPGTPRSIAPTSSRRSALIVRKPKPSSRLRCARGRDERSPTCSSR